MKKLVYVIVAWFAFAVTAFAAVNINTANKEQLTTLKGIGDSKAQAIIDYRTKNGPFKSVDDLDKVKGIGPGILGKIKSDISVSGETTAAAPAAKDDKAAKKADAKPTDAKPVSDDVAKKDKKQ